MSVYPGYNKTIEYEIGEALLLAERTCTAPNASSIVNFAVDLPRTHITFHTLMKILSGSFCLFVIVVAGFLLAGHVTHWAIPAQQRQIARVIIFLPVYAIGAFISISLYRTQPYVAPVPDWYEGFAIVAIFYLFVTYITPDPSTRAQVLDRIATQKDAKGPAKRGAKGYHRTCLFVYQIIPSRLIFLVATEVLYAKSCPLSQSLRNGVLIIEVVQSFSTTLAVVAVIRFQKAHNTRMPGHNATLKLWIFKSVVGLEFVQNVLFSALAQAKVYRPTQYVSYYDMYTGLNQFMISCECFLYAFAYIKAFEFGSYRKMIKGGDHAHGSPLRAILDIVNPMDIIRDTVVAFTEVKYAQQAGTNGDVTTNGFQQKVSGEARVNHKADSDSSV